MDLHSLHHTWLESQMNYESPSLAVDVLVLMPDIPNQRMGFVLIQRKNPPLGCALPGGFVDVGETSRNAAIREMQEELNMEVQIVRLLGVYDEPDRDPRKHVCSIAYLAVAADPNAQPVAGDDAKEAFVWYVDQPIPEMVCDHAQILQDAISELNL